MLMKPTLKVGNTAEVTALVTEDMCPAFDDVVVSDLVGLYQKCVHLGCRVPWCASSQGFECPCHGSKYNAHGEYAFGPAPRNLDRFAIEIVDDRLIINTGQIRDTPRAKVKTIPYPQGVNCL